MVWNVKSLPKIDMFSWTLVHGRVLTYENLEIRWIVGLFCYPLCKESKETGLHFLVSWSFARKVWRELIHHQFGNKDHPSSIQQCYATWDHMYQGNLDNKTGFKTCWRMIPKVMFWNIQIERNQRIFKDKCQTLEQIVVKTQALMGEIMNASLMLKKRPSLHQMKPVGWSPSTFLKQTLLQLRNHWKYGN